MPDPSAPQLFSRLRFLQLSDQPLVSKLAHLIVQLAVLGGACTAVASRLLAQLNAYQTLHGQNHVLRPLWLLWDRLHAWPEGERARVEREIIAEKKKSKRKGEKTSAAAYDDQEPAPKHAKTVEASEDEQELTDEEIAAYIQELALNWARNWWYPGKRDVGAEEKGLHERPLTSAEKRLAIRRILQGIGEMQPEAFKNASTGTMAMDVSSGLVSALDLTLSLEDDRSEPEEGAKDSEEDNVPSAAEILDMISKRLSANQQFAYLAQSKHYWEIIARGEEQGGTLLNVDAEDMRAFTQQLESATTERLQNGRLQLSDLPIKTLLEMLQHNALHNPAAEPEEYGLSPADSLFKDPAPASLITQTEARLNIKLPQDYKEFLSVTNGFGRLYNGYFYTPALHPCTEIRWLDPATEDYFTELPLDLFDIDATGVWLTQLLKPDNESFYTITVGNAIEIGTMDIENTWLLPPDRVAAFQRHVRNVLSSDEVDEDKKTSVRKRVKDFAGSEDAFYALEWCCMTWAAGGAVAMYGYPGFKAYLRQMVEEGDMGTKNDLLEREEFWGYEFVKETRAVRQDEI